MKNQRILNALLTLLMTSLLAVAACATASDEQANTPGTADASIHPDARPHPVDAHPLVHPDAHAPFPDAHPITPTMDGGFPFPGGGDGGLPFPGGGGGGGGIPGMCTSDSDCKSAGECCVAFGGAGICMKGTSLPGIGCLPISM